VSLDIIHATTPDQIAQARSLIVEYAASLGVDLCFQGFDEELSSLSVMYGPPDGRLLLAMVDGQSIGCGAIRRLETDCCEMKRLYVRSTARGLGAGRRLAEALLREARLIGYARMRLDTLLGMTDAQALYKTLGFQPIPPYRHNPVPGSTFLELAL
jgi:putative acetyltransferase